MSPLFAWSACLMLAAPLASAADPPDVRKALDNYYEERLKQPFIRNPNDPEPKVSPPPWAAPIQRFASEKADDRRAAGAYLRELLVLALEDETSGKAPWRNTPYWGGGADVPARDLRKDVADELAKVKPSAEVLPVLKWYLKNEPMDRLLAPVVTALGKIDGDEADALRTELATTPHPNATVTADAIRQILARKKTLPADTLAALCQHHRAAIRAAARALNTQQGGKDPGAFDAAKAVRSTPVVKVMDGVLKLLPDLPGAKAEYVHVTVRYFDDKKAERKKTDDRGWLLKKDGDTVTIFTPYGRTQSARDKEQLNVKISERSADGRGWTSYDIDATTEVTVTPADVAGLVKEVAASRKGGDAGNDLSERGPLTGQFRGSGATLFEAILGTWLFRAGRDEDAAKVLLPALDSVYRDEHLTSMVRNQMGELVGQQMLVAFVGDRDYPAAIKHAKQINELYAGTRFHFYAKELAEQLPKRTDDFTKLKLPTPAEWTELKKTLTRAQQIDYLCERMRLMNCFQMGQPGGYNPGAKQYAEPCGLSEDAAWGLRRGKTEVINPLVELTGYQGWRGDDEPKPKGMELTLKDVPQLSKYLRDNHYMLIVSFWRDFAADRNLSGTRSEFVEIIDGLACRDICHTDQWKDRTPAEIDKQINRINAWAAANAHKTPLQLDREVLDERIAAGGEWDMIKGRVGWLLKQKQTDMYDVMKQYLTKKSTSDWHRAEILNLYLQYDVTRAKDLAPEYLTDKETGLRLAAARIVFKTGDKAKARPVLGDIVATGDESFGTAVAMSAAEALLEDDTPESRKQLARLFTNPHLPHERSSRPAVLARCAAAGLKEPYTFYLKLLDNNDNRLPILDAKGEPSGASHYEPSVAEEFATEIVKRFAPDDDAVKDIAKKFPKTKDQIPHLKKWLQSKSAKKD